MVLPSPRNAPTHGLQEAGPNTRANAGPLPGSQSLCSGQHRPGLPTRPPARPRLRAWTQQRTERYPLVDPAGLLMLAAPGRSGWWALLESRPTASASPPGSTALQPPSSLRGSRAGQVGVGRALLPRGAQNSFHRGDSSILKFLPGSCKTAALGDVA